MARRAAGYVATAPACLLAASAPAGTLNRGTAAEPGTLDPQTATGSSAAPIRCDLDVGRTAVDALGEIGPGLAASWTLSEDGLASTNPNNYSGYASEAFDARYRDGNANLDAAGRLRRLAEAEAIALADPPVAPVYHFTRRYLVARQVKGFIPNLRGVALSRYLSVAR